MKKHLIESQRPDRQLPSIASGHTFGKRENIDAPKGKRMTVVNISPPLAMYTSTLFVGATSAPLFGQNLRRRYLLIQNVGATTVFIGFGSTPSVNGDNGVEIPSGVQISFESGYVPTNDANAICATQGKLIIVEGILVD